MAEPALLPPREVGADWNVTDGEGSATPALLTRQPRPVGALMRFCRVTVKYGPKSRGKAVHLLSPADLDFYSPPRGEKQGNQPVAHIIVVGNEKGGAGKSTVSMHVATALARMGHRIGVIDLDLRQLTVGRYIQNRQNFCAKEGLNLATPDFVPLPKSEGDSAQADDQRLYAALGALQETHDFVLIDCPGSHTRLAQVAHSLADTLITPLNDSFVDFDMLARVDSDGEEIIGPSIYSEMVWSAKQPRAQAGLDPIDWVVVRNRVGAQAMINKDKMERVVAKLAKRIGFRTAPGFGERVIFRELFPRGLTLLDLKDAGVRGLSISNIAARQELRELIKALNLPGVKPKF